jgi:hypothetical protein
MEWTWSMKMDMMAREIETSSDYSFDEIMPETRVVFSLYRMTLALAPK